MRGSLGPSPLPKVTTLVAGIISSFGASVSATELSVHNGMSATQIKDVAEQLGWSTKIDSSSQRLELQAGSRSAEMQLYRCDGQNVCQAGMIRSMSFHSADGKGCSIWHWNLQAKGATGFGPDYATLQRYVNFRGTTRQYLMDVLADWRTASDDFWSFLEQCSAGDAPNQEP